VKSGYSGSFPDYLLGFGQGNFVSFDVSDVVRVPFETPFFIVYTLYILAEVHRGIVERADRYR
jgi:hypothetical protein